MWEKKNAYHTKNTSRATNKKLMLHSQSAMDTPLLNEVKDTVTSEDQTSQKHDDVSSEAWDCDDLAQGACMSSLGVNFQDAHAQWLTLDQWGLPSHTFNRLQHADIQQVPSTGTIVFPMQLRSLTIRLESLSELKRLGVCSADRVDITFDGPEATDFSRWIPCVFPFVRHLRLRILGAESCQNGHACDRPALFDLAVCSSASVHIQRLVHLLHLAVYAAMPVLVFVPESVQKMECGDVSVTLKGGHGLQSLRSLGSLILDDVFPRLANVHATNVISHHTYPRLVTLMTTHTADRPLDPAHYPNLETLTLVDVAGSLRFCQDFVFLKQLHLLPACGSCYTLGPGQQRLLQTLVIQGGLPSDWAASQFPSLKTVAFQTPGVIGPLPASVTKACLCLCCPFDGEEQPDDRLDADVVFGNVHHGLRTLWLVGMVPDRLDLRSLRTLNTLRVFPCLTGESQLTVHVPAGVTRLVHGPQFNVAASLDSVGSCDMEETWTTSMHEFVAAEIKCGLKSSYVKANQSSILFSD